VDVQSFDEIRDDFSARVQRIVWCTVATVDRGGRPRSRILHPIWEGPTGWICTGRQSLKARHLEKNPFVSLTYWDAQQEQVYAECRAEWAEGEAERRRLWELFKGTPAPYGYDPGMFWAGPDDPGFGLLKLTPWRIEVSGIAEMMQGRQPRVWRPS
jgi:general stress protein 26